MSGLLCWHGAVKCTGAWRGLLAPMGWACWVLRGPRMKPAMSGDASANAEPLGRPRGDDFGQLDRSGELERGKRLGVASGVRPLFA